MKQNYLRIIGDILGLVGYILLVTVNWKIALGVFFIQLFTRLSYFK